MNKWRRYHKQYLARRLKRYRAIRSAIRLSIAATTAAAGAVNISLINATAAAKFAGGELEKLARLARAVIDTNTAIQKAWLAFP